MVFNQRHIFANISFSSILSVMWTSENEQATYTGIQKCAPGKYLIHKNLIQMLGSFNIATFPAEV